MPVDTRQNGVCRSWLGAALAVWALAPAVCAAEAADAAVGVKVPEGFEVSLFADDELAHDIFSMTIDAYGRVVVSGPGYVRILPDQNGDGRADGAIQFADGPQTGAQGLFFFGRDLLCSGDQGLLRYQDRNGDDRADGPPDLLLKIKAGGEHDVHAIRKGPDGWWYVIAGNGAGVNENYITLATSPVKVPVAGTVLRFRPDFSAGEVVVDGFRNAYDFDFHPQGDLIVFDSDGEREVSLPWYQPTRVFVSLPGSNHGWLSRSWKRPNEFLDMPPVLAEFGRGSPTGVVAYRHTQFPEPYRGALFVLDWTFGRVWALPTTPAGSVWKAEPIEFMSALGEHGFAPTDAEVGPDGCLYVSVGGRGTRGGVYRIRAVKPAATAWDPQPTTEAEKVEFCLRAPQPLSSWSRRVWEPWALELKSEAFIRAAEDPSRSGAERARAIEILTEKFHGLDNDLMSALMRSESPIVRARALWSLGRTRPLQPNGPFIADGLADEDPFVVRAALEALLAADPAVLTELAEPLGKVLGHPDRFVRQAATLVLARTDADTFRSASATAINASWQGAISVAAAYSRKRPGYAPYTTDIGIRVLKGDYPPAMKLEAARLIELGLGDVGPSDDGADAAFDGYRSRIDLSGHDQELDKLRIAISELYPSGDSALDLELERIMAIIQPANDALLDRVVAQITERSHPVDDIHRLIVIARLPVERSPEQRVAIARGLVNLERKIRERDLRQDSYWDDRVMGMYQMLVQRDPALPVALLEQEGFGLPGHVQFTAEMPPEKFDAIVDAFVRKIEADPDYAWNSDVVFLLGASAEPVHLSMVRAKVDDFSLRSAVLMVLAEEPAEVDRGLFVAGLESSPLQTLADCLKALALLEPSDDPAENVALLQTVRRLSPQGQEREARDQAAELLRINLGRDFGYVLGRDGDLQLDAVEKWTAYVQQRFPEEFARQTGAGDADQQQLQEMLAAVDWANGDPGRGALLFRSRGCAQCHGSRRALGPDLSGVTSRFSPKDLFIAIAFPHRDVSPRYQTTQIVTRQGHVRTGLIVYESVDGVVLRDSGNVTYRIEAADIDARRTLNQSLMPSGLLRGLSEGDLTDLYAYLRRPTTRTADSQAVRSDAEGESR